MLLVYLFHGSIYSLLFIFFLSAVCSIHSLLLLYNFNSPSTWVSFFLSFFPSIRRSAIWIRPDRDGEEEKESQVSMLFIYRKQTIFHFAVAAASLLPTYIGAMAMVMAWWWCDGRSDRLVAFQRFVHEISPSLIITWGKLIMKIWFALLHQTNTKFFSVPFQAPSSLALRSEIVMSRCFPSLSAVYN